MSVRDRRVQSAPLRLDNCGFQSRPTLVSEDHKVVCMKNFTALLCYVLLALTLAAGVISWKLYKQRDCRLSGHSYVYCVLRR